MKIEPISQLRDICQLPILENEGWYARNYARRVSIYLTRVLLYSRITANQVTISGIAMGISGSLLFLKAGYWINIIGAIFLHVWHLLDHCDGEIARYRKSSSGKGIFFDILSHNFVIFSIFLCISFRLYFSTQNILVFTLGFFAIFSLALTYNISLFKRAILVKIERNNKINESKTAFKRNKKYQTFFAKYNIFSKSIFWTTAGLVWVLLVCTLFNKLGYALLVFAITTPFRLTFRIIETIREVATQENI